MFEHAAIGNQRLDKHAHDTMHAKGQCNQMLVKMAWFVEAIME